MRREKREIRDQKSEIRRGELPADLRRREAGQTGSSNILFLRRDLETKTCYIADHKRKIYRFWHEERSKLRDLRALRGEKFLTTKDTKHTKKEIQGPKVNFARRKGRQVRKKRNIFSASLAENMPAGHEK